MQLIIERNIFLDNDIAPSRNTAVRIEKEQVVIVERGASGQLLDKRRLWFALPSRFCIDLILRILK